MAAVYDLSRTPDRPPGPLPAVEADEPPPGAELVDISDDGTWALYDAGDVLVWVPIKSP